MRPVGSAYSIAVVLASVSTATLVRLLAHPKDGLAFIRSLQKGTQHRRIPAIALSAYASIADREEALAAGCFEHVPKPVHPYNLARVIAAALRPPS